MRKNLMQNWQRERRKVMEARNALKVAKSKYYDLGHELTRVSSLVIVLLLLLLIITSSCSFSSSSTSFSFLFFSR